MHSYKRVSISYLRFLSLVDGLRRYASEASESFNLILEILIIGCEPQQMERTVPVQVSISYLRFLSLVVSLHDRRGQAWVGFNLILEILIIG